MFSFAFEEPKASEIRAAHAKAVGGKRDKCNKGKSCSAACIERKDRCLIDFPEPASRATTKVRDRVSQPELFPTEGYTDKGYIRDFKKRVERELVKAIQLMDEDKYNKHRQEVIDFNKRVGGESSSSALKVPATWERVENVREAYEKAKGKLMRRLEKAAEDGDRKKYFEEEARFLSIKRKIGVKVGDTGKYVRGDIWYGKAGGLTELNNKLSKVGSKPETAKDEAKRVYESRIKALYRTAGMGDRPLFDTFTKSLEKFKQKLKDDGIKIVVKGLDWDKATQTLKNYDKKFSAMVKEVEKAANKGDTKGANRAVEALYKLHVSEGSKLGKDFPLERVEFARKGGFLLPQPEPIRPFPLTNAKEFYNAIRISRMMSEDFHDKFAKLLDPKSYSGREGRDKIMERLGISEPTFAKAIKLIKRYTDTYYQEIQDARKDLAAGLTLNSYQKTALRAEGAIERFIAAFPKEEIVKFRGGRMGDARLQGMIESAKLKESFSRGLLASWSSSLTKAKDFADSPPEGTGNKPNRVILVTVNRRGIPVESITEVPGEMELLTSKAARYTHTGNYHKVDYDGQTYHIFEVIER